MPVDEYGRLLQAALPTPIAGLERLGHDHIDPVAVGLQAHRLAPKALADMN